MDEIILIDTDVIIDYFNGISPMADAVEQLIEREILGLSTISIFELYAGIISKRRIKAIDAICRTAITIPLDEPAAKEAGKIYTYLKQQGQLIGNQDILLAGICITNGLSILTNNIEHFQRIRGLRVLTPQDIL